MSFDNNNSLSISESNDDLLTNSEQTHLTLVSDNSEFSEKDPIEAMKTYLRLVEDSVNMLFLTTILEAKVRKENRHNF